MNMIIDIPESFMYYFKNHGFEDTLHRLWIFAHIHSMVDNDDVKVVDTLVDSLKTAKDAGDYIPRSEAQYIIKQICKKHNIDYDEIFGHAFDK